MKILETITVQRPLKLHLEEFIQLVNIAKRFHCRIKVQQAGKRAGDGNSWALLTLAAPPDCELQLYFDGKFAQGAAMAVRELLEKGTVENKSKPLEIAGSFFADPKSRPLERGALISSVIPETASQKAGLKPGDIVLALNGKKVTGTADLVAKLFLGQPGDRVEFTILRSGEQMTVRVRLQKLSEKNLPEGTVTQERQGEDP